MPDGDWKSISHCSGRGGAALRVACSRTRLHTQAHCNQPTYLSVAELETHEDGLTAQSLCLSVAVSPLL